MSGYDYVVKGHGGLDRFEIAKALMKAFPGSFINRNGEFIADPKSNTYFNLDRCRSILDVECSILEWLSRAAYKTEPYSSKRHNKDFQAKMRLGINTCLGTKFNAEDFILIYTYLGNSCNHARTVEFVECGYDMEILRELDRKEAFGENADIKSNC